MLKKILTALAILIISSIAIVIFSYFSIREKINKPLDAGDTRTVSFEIRQGEGVKDIAKELADAKLITGKDFFKIYLWEKNLGSKLKAGTYELSPSMNIPQMVDVFTRGESGLKSNEARVVIAEGFTNDDILAELKKDGAVPADSSFDNISIDAAKFDFLSDKPENDSLEGYLFPDTYNFFKGSTLNDVTAKMLENFASKVNPDLRAAIKDRGKSLYDILIMASIIEKESPDKQDMPTIAGVFYNRLDSDMPLQSDATVNYITKGGRAMPTSDDLAVDSPFNTYKYKGLPPAPICNPGIEAIKAAVYPQKTDYYYFLMPQDGEGKTIFSKTYEEHLQNKARYLK